MFQVLQTTYFFQKQLYQVVSLRFLIKHSSWLIYLHSYIQQEQQLESHYVYAIFVDFGVQVLKNRVLYLNDALALQYDDGQVQAFSLQVLLNQFHRLDEIMKHLIQLNEASYNEVVQPLLEVVLREFLPDEQRYLELK